MMRKAERAQGRLTTRSRRSAASVSPNAAADLSRAFVRDVLADWKANGASAISNARAERPHDYLKMVTGLFPKVEEPKVDGFDELSDEQLAVRLAAALTKLERAGIEVRGRTPPADTA